MEGSAAEVLVFGTINAAVLCWAAAVVWRSPAAWTAGALLTLVHSVAAFGLFYGWSHDTARLLTAQQTAALTGIEFSGAIYVNYLFIAVWTGDAAWQRLAPASYRARSAALAIAVHLFLFFIIVNGAVVFADGWARLIGLAAVAAVIIVTRRRFAANRVEAFREPA